MIKTNTFSILSLIFAFLFFPLGLIFGIVALVQIKKSHENGKGLAIAGIIISVIPIMLISLIFSFTNQNAIFSKSQPTETTQIKFPESIKPIAPQQKIKSGTLSVDKVIVSTAVLSKIRMTINNTGSVSFNPEFDIFVINNEGEIICEDSSSPFSSVGLISAGKEITEEIQPSGACIFKKDGDYTIKVDMLDEDFKKLDSSEKPVTVNYYGQFGLGGLN